MENKTQRLIKIGDQIHFTAVGNECELECSKVYVARVDRMSDDVYLEENAPLVMPKDLYTPAEDIKFINKVLNRFNNEKTQGTTGVILAGLKGTGKTVMAKNIAMRSNLPIITLDKNFPPREIISLMNKIKDERVCIIIDEIDKIKDRAYDDHFLLQLFDGVSTCGNNLILATCNNINDVNDYLLDRCSRVRYYKEFGELTPSMIQSILNEKLDNKDILNTVADFVSMNFGLASFDNVSSFAEEINNNPEETLEDLFKDMNISEK